MMYYNGMTAEDIFRYAEKYCLDFQSKEDMLEAFQVVYDYGYDERYAEGVDEQ